MSNILENFRATALRVGITGAIHVANMGATTPTIGEGYGEEFRNVGYISGDGVEVSFDEDANEFIPWQEMAPIRRDITKSITAVKFTLWDFGRKNAEFFFGGEVDMDDDGTYHVDVKGKPDFKRQLFVLDVIDGTKAMRIEIPAGQLTERGSVVFKSDEAMAMECTITAFPADPTDYSDNRAGVTARWTFSKEWDAEGKVGDILTQGSDLGITTAILPDATVGEEYSVNLQAKGGSAPYTWRLASGNLPEGLELNEQGQITGTPTAAGNKQPTLEVTDSANATATKKYSLRVADAA